MSHNIPSGCSVVSSQCQTRRHTQWWPTALSTVTIGRCGGPMSAPGALGFALRTMMPSSPRGGSQALTVVSGHAGNVSTACSTGAPTTCHSESAIVRRSALTSFAKCRAQGAHELHSVKPCTKLGYPRLYLTPQYPREPITLDPPRLPIARLHSFSGLAAPAVSDRHEGIC
jgi:hypothetical protein